MSELVDVAAVVGDSVQWLVIDESDKLFEDGETGFRQQVGTLVFICKHFWHAMHYIAKRGLAIACCLSVHL